MAEADTGQLIEANPVALDLIGRRTEELTSMTILDLHPEEDRGRLWDAFKKAAEEDHNPNHTCRVLHKDGSWTPCEIRSKRWTENGRRLVMGIFRDISEQVRTSEDINLRNIAIASMSSGVTIADARQPDEYNREDDHKLGVNAGGHSTCLSLLARRVAEQVGFLIP